LRPAQVLEVRKMELGELRKAIPIRVGMQTLLFAAPMLAMVACFAVYGTVAPAQFTPAAIFTSIALFGLMRFPLIFLPFALVGWDGGEGGGGGWHASVHMPTHPPC
jgi:hypothetical protein